MPRIERDEQGRSVALSWARGETLGQSRPSRVAPGAAREAREASCAGSGTQRALDFDPELIRVAQPPHNTGLVRKLKPAALHVLALLEDGRPHSRQELQAVGGNRYAARVEELRASGKVILGPRKSPKHGLWRTEPMGPGQVERYRMVYGVKP